MSNLGNWKSMSRLGNMFALFVCELIEKHVCWILVMIFNCLNVARKELRQLWKSIIWYIFTRNSPNMALIILVIRPMIFLWRFPEKGSLTDVVSSDTGSSESNICQVPTCVNGTTNTVYGTTNADAGLGIGMKRGDSKNWLKRIWISRKSYELTENNINNSQVLVTKFKPIIN